MLECYQLGIGYESDARRAMELAEEQVRVVEGVLEDPPPHALVSQLGASSVDLRIFIYTAPTYDQWLLTLSESILRTKEAFDAAGINIPFSTHTIDVRHVDELNDHLKNLGQEQE